MSIIIGILVICFLIALLSEFWPIIFFGLLISPFVYFVVRINKETKSSFSEEVSLPPIDAPSVPVENKVVQLCDCWPADKLYTRRVRERLQRAKSEDLKVGRKINSSTYLVNSYDQETYKTSLTSCTCVDFSYKQTPCKHILKLALEIGALDPDDELFGIPEEVDARFQSLSKAAQKELLGLIYSRGYQVFDRFIVKRSTNLESLIKNGFVIENVDPEYFLNNAYTVSELKAILKEYQNRTGIKISKSSDSKSVLIQNIINAGDDCLNLFTLQKILLEFDPEIAPHAISLYDKYSK